MLYDYFSFLEANELDWRDVDRGEQRTLVAAYRGWNRDDNKLKVNTVSQRLVYICKFYEYAFRLSWIERLPYGYETRHLRRNNDFLAHADASGGEFEVRDVMPRRHHGLPRQPAVTHHIRLERFRNGVQSLFRFNPFANAQERA